MAKRKKKINKKLRTQRRIVLVLVVVIFVLAGAIAVSDGLMKQPQVEQPPVDSTANSGMIETDIRKEGVYNILLCGLDDDNGGSDTMMLFSLDSEGKKAHLVSIPRDTLVDEDWTVKKINSAFNRGGIEEVEHQVEKIMGFPVDYYVTVDLKGFIELVDALDGISFNVPIDMNYDDPVQDLHIHFKAGEQLLNGQQAMEVMRFRKNNNGGGYPMQDLGRIQTQQAFMKTVAEKVLSPSSLTKIPEYIRIFSENVDSNLSSGEMVWLGNQAKSIGVENISFTTLPGTPATYHHGSYYVLDPAACLDLINTSLNPYENDRIAEDLQIKIA